VARESNTFGGGVFSRALINGLRGSADQDEDGRITLNEAYDYALSETVRATAASGQAIQRPEVRYAIEGIGDVVLTRVPSRAATLVLPEELEGTYAVVSVQNGEVVARVVKEPGELRRIALPAGRYVVRKVRREDVLLAELSLVWGGDRWVSDEQMTQVALGDPLAKGGWTPRPVRLAVRGAFSSPLMKAGPVSFGGEFGAQGTWSRKWGVAGFGGVLTGRRGDWQASTRTWQGQVGFGALYEQRLRQVDLSVSMGGMASLLAETLAPLAPDEDDERPPGGESLLQFTGGGWVRGGLHVPMGPALGFDVQLHFSVQPLRVVPDTIQASVQGGVLLGMAFGLRGKAGRIAARDSGDLPGQRLDWVAVLPETMAQDQEESAQD